MTPLARLTATLFVSWAGTFWFSLLLFGAWTPLNLMACGGIGLAAAVAATATAAVAPAPHRLRLRWLRHLASVPHRVVLDFGILTRELARTLATGEVREGVFRARPSETGPPDSELGAGWRAFVGAVAGYSPNAYVVEIDPERRQVLVHDLVANERSEAPA